MSRKHKRPSAWRRLKHKIKRRRWIIPVMIIAVIVIAIGAVLVITDLKNQESQQVTAGNSTYTGSGFREVSWKGQNYKFNNQLITILLSGLDSEGKMEEYTSYTTGPQSDSIQLLVIDPQMHEMHIVALDRNTITKIRKYTVSGYDRGLFEDFLCFAFMYGNGGKASCENLAEAVSLLMYNVPIRDYVVMNRSSLEAIAKIVGPVEVTVPNDDLAEADPKYTKDSTVVVDATNIDQYVHYRNTDEHFSNEGRMQRQESYINAAMAQFMEKIENEPDAVWKDLEQMEDCMQTNITRNRYLELVKATKDIDYTSDNFIIPEGEAVVGTYYDEFYVDQEALIEIILDLFYIAQ